MSNPTGFSPSSITTGCQVWFDGSDSTTITTSATYIQSWNDKSGNNYHMTQSGGYSNGTISSNFQNNLNVANFSGLNLYRAPSGSGCYPSDCYVVLASKALARTDFIGIGATSVDNFNSLTLGEYTSLRWHNGSSSFARTPNTVSTSNETSTGFLLINWSLADNNYILRRNGTLMTQTNSYTYSLTAGSIFQIGFRHTNLNPSLNMDAYIAEIVVYNSQLNTSNQQKVEAYLAWKWGIQSSLPSTHPYYYFPFIPSVDTIPRSIPNNAYIVPVNTYSTIKTFNLPVVSTNAGRMLILKDHLGYAGSNYIYLSTQGLDRIERSNVSSMVLSNAFGAWTFMNDGFTNWFMMDAYRNSLGIVPQTPPFSNYLWTQFRNMTSSGPSFIAGGSGWGNAIGTSGAYNPINYQDGDSRAGQSDFVGVVCKGYFYSASNTTVNFRIIVDDGGYVWFNNTGVITNAWVLQGDTTYTSATLNVTAGYTPFQFYFYEWGGGMTCELYYSIAGGGYQSDGTGRFFHDTSSKTYP